MNKLFQDIYVKDRDKIKKAMYKCYFECAGTVLCANWGEISTEEVKVQPPDGLENSQFDIFLQVHKIKVVFIYELCTST